MRMRKNKFNAKRTSCGATDHPAHASRKEAIRCSELQALQKGKLIRGLVQQPKFPIVIYGEKICTYIGDWVFEERGPDGEWRKVLADCKGMKTPIYKIKKKLVKAIYGITIRET